jgi:hypothetical protein
MHAGTANTGRRYNFNRRTAKATMNHGGMGRQDLIRDGGAAAEKFNILHAEGWVEQTPDRVCSEFRIGMGEISAAIDGIVPRQDSVVSEHYPAASRFLVIDPAKDILHTVIRDRFIR